MANSIDPDKATHNELPHLDLHCLQIQLGFFFALKGLNYITIHVYATEGSDFTFSLIKQLTEIYRHVLTVF